jgi:hypothetical protein
MIKVLYKTKIKSKEGISMNETMKTIIVCQVFPKLLPV